MYQSPMATQTRPAARPAATTTPTSPVSQLAGRRVTQEMFYTAHQAKKAGQRCFLVDAEDTFVSQRATADCANCNGYGRLALEVVVAGPFEDVPASGPRGTGEVATHVSIASHNGSWFQVVRSYCDCPVCGTTRVIQL